MENLQEKVIQKVKDKKISRKIMECVKKELINDNGKKILFIEFKYKNGFFNKEMFSDVENFMNKAIEKQDKIINIGFDYAKNISEFNLNQRQVFETLHS